MLVITRREEEEVVIGDPAKPYGIIRIVSIKGDRVRLVFDFPRAIDVHRREVADQILASTPPASGTIRPSADTNLAPVNMEAAYAGAYDGDGNEAGQIGQLYCDEVHDTTRIGGERDLHDRIK